MGAVETFLILSCVTISSFTVFELTTRNSMNAVPFTGGRMRAFITSGEGGGGAGATAGAASFFGVEAVLFADWAKAAVASARQQRTAADVSAGRLIVFLLRGYPDSRPATRRRAIRGEYTPLH